MTEDLPTNLVRYFEAQNAHDPEAASETFAPDAEVRDEGRTYFGRPAIREWKRETDERYSATARPIEATREGDSLAVVAEVSGNFPGSPANLTFRFGLDPAGLIRTLEIG